MLNRSPTLATRFRARAPVPLIDSVQRVARHGREFVREAELNSATTYFDDIEQSITDLRVGPSLATPDLLVLSPNTWSVIRREKDNYGRYLVAPDPSKDQVNTAWGVDVLSTTAMTPGTGMLIDTTKFGVVLVRGRADDQNRILR